MGQRHVVFASLLLALAPIAEVAQARSEAVPLDKKGNQRAVKLAWLANDPNNTYDGAALDGASEVADANHSTVTAFYAGFNPSVQLEQCLDVVRSKKFDAIAVLPADSISIVTCVEEARKRSIPVVAVDLPIGPDNTTVEPQVPGQAGAVLVPPADWGRALADLVVEACADESDCEVGYIAGAFSVALDIGALAELDSLEATHPNIRIVAREEAFYSRELAAVVASDMLDEHPTISVIIGAGDQMAQGVEDAIALRPAYVSPKIIVGAGAGEYGVQAVRDGRWYATFVTLPRDEGVLGAEIAIRAARRQPILDPGINPVTRHGWPSFFTAENQHLFVGFEPQWR